MILPTSPRWTPSGCHQALVEVQKFIPLLSNAYLDHDIGALFVRHVWLCWIWDEPRKRRKRFLYESYPDLIRPRDKLCKQDQIPVRKWPARHFPSNQRFTMLFGPLSISLAPYVRSSKTLTKWLTPIAHWYANAAGWRKYGFKYDDLCRWTPTCWFPSSCSLFLKCNRRLLRLKRFVLLISISLSFMLFRL